MSKSKTLGDELQDLAAQAVPLEDKSRLTIDVAEIPLPPAELLDQLDNSGAKPAETEADAGEAVTLDFCGDDLPFVVFPLKYPFRWQGERVETITVRQLTTAEVGRLAGQASGGKRLDLYDLYGAMTGLPAAVLRALPTADGEPIIDKAFDFLPRLFRPGGG